MFGAPDSLYRGYRCIEDRYIGILNYTFYYNFCQDIEFLSLYREYRYIEDRYIGVPLYYKWNRLLLEMATTILAQ